VLSYRLGFFDWRHYPLSNSQKTRTTVEIYGQQYVILGTESLSHIRLVASLVDDKMREISSKNPSLNVNKLAVLTAVNAVNDYIKMKDQLEKLQDELKREKD
jgi:cell division protein ZapA